MRARLARWTAAFTADRSSPDLARPSALPSADGVDSDAEGVEGALVLLARRIYETATAAPWQDAGFHDRARSFLIARAVLLEMEAHDWLDPALARAAGAHATGQRP
ncbi:MAG: hypothetical protein AB1592_17025 [Pseudomonadota bacterium]